MNSTQSFSASSVGVGAPDRSLLDAMVRAPYRFDFFQALRRVESFTPSLPRIGWATRTDQEWVRIGQSVHLDFAPATIDEVSWTDTGRLRMQQRFFGLWGPAGALPLPMTESARDQWRHEGDRTQIAFADIFHHRMATLLYRVWSTSRGAIQRDRPEEDRFAFYVASLGGIYAPAKPPSRPKTFRSDTTTHAAGTFACAGGPPAASTPTRALDQPSDTSIATAAIDIRRFHAARFGVRRNADGLQALLSGAFGVNVAVRTFVPTTLQLREEDHARVCRYGCRDRIGNTLGGGLVLGRRIEDHASTIEVAIGPLDLATYRSLMPGGSAHCALHGFARDYVGRGLQIQVRLILEKHQRPVMQLGSSSTLGRDTWIAVDHAACDTGDYRFIL